MVGGLIAIAPAPPTGAPLISDQAQKRHSRGRGTLHYIPDDEVYAWLSIRAGFVLGCWRLGSELDAYRDGAALGYVSGPMYERHVDSAGREITVPLGDLKFGRRVWKAQPLGIGQQAIGIKYDGSIDFGYGD